MNERARAQHRRQRGFSLFETMVAVGLVACGLLVVVQQLSLGFRESSSSDNRAFAYQKAAAILAEIQNGIALGQITKSSELLAFHDSVEKVVLTTRLDSENLPFEADHPMSGNYQRRNHWMWARKISVEPSVETGLYLCRVTISRWGDTNRWEREAVQALQFSLLPEPDAPEQALDVYLLACGAAPSLAGDLAELRTHYENAAATIRQQSQADLRLHWITRLGYGRDPCYTPYVNVTTAADEQAPFAYWLPGRLADDSGTLYRQELLGGMCRTESGVFGGGSATEPWPVTIADQNNHCLRTPAARTLFERRVAAGIERAEEPPLQLLLDDLAVHPERYRNAVFVNLHGSGLPLPPLRNYTDAARDPEHFAGVRVVTHPARLHTPRDPNGDGNHNDSQDLELRVYAYRTAGTGDVLSTPILVQIFGPDLTGAVNAASNPTLLVHRLQGGIDPATGLAVGNNRNYIGFDEATGAAPRVGEQLHSMRCESGFVSGPSSYTWLKLYNTPLVAPAVGTRGLQTSARLYGLEYVPSAVTGTFARDLAYDSATAIARNTARWRIRIPAKAFANGAQVLGDTQLRVVTRIGADTATGIRWPAPWQPLNISETYAWWTRSATAVPVTERAQVLGDPRCCPYSDLTSSGTTFAHGYNWHFDDFVAGSTNATSLWTGFDATRLRDGFGLGVRADAPRLLQMLRQGLQSAGAVLVLPQGKTADTMLLGGEIIAGATAAPTKLHPTWSAGATAIDTVHAGPTTGSRTLVLGSSPTWWAMPWLGELFPDAMHADWFAQGNLPLTGTGSGLQWQLAHQVKNMPLPTGTSWDAPRGAQAGDAGATMLLTCGTRSATFATPDAASYSAQPTVAQNEINVATNLVPPSSVPALAEIRLNWPLGTSVPALDRTDTYPRCTSTLMQSLWLRSSQVTGGIYDCADALGKRAFFVPWVSTAGATPMREVAEQALLAGMRAIHVAGNPGLAARIPQLPRLELLEPQAGTSLPPDAITLRWQTTWRRFDDQPYTSSMGTGFTETESNLLYRVLWSPDQGVTWNSALTGRTTEPGTWPAEDDCLRDTSTGSESFTLTSMSALPDGEYLLLLEAWRSETHCHSAAQRVPIQINHAAAPPRRGS